MKKIVPVMSVIAIMITCINVAKAQQKIGHVDLQYILSYLPEYKAMESQLITLESQLTKQMQAKNQEMQEKYQQYLQTSENMAEVVRQDKEKELTQLQERFQEFQQNAQTSLQQKSNELLKPLYKKIGDAIEQVALENGYAHILNAGVSQLDIVIYGDEKFDVSDLVLKKLGIEPPAN